MNGNGSSLELGRDLAIALDPARLLVAAGLTPDAWQAALLRSDWQRALLLCCRQSGKSTVTAALAVWTALYQAPAEVLCLAPSLRQSQELFAKVVQLYRLLQAAAPAEAESALRLRLANGSRILALPGKEQTIRGYSGVSLLIVDEAARVPDELYLSVRPMLAVSGGRLVALSTPFGKRGWYHQEWTAGGPGWHRVQVTAAQCPRIPRTFLAEERASLGDWWYSQEYDCVFRDAIDSVFSTDTVLAAISDRVQPLFAPAHLPQSGNGHSDAVKPLFLGGRV